MDFQQPQRIAKGSKWGKSYVLSRLLTLGLPENEICDALYKVEHQFSILGGERGSQAEWSIKFAEVTGFPEDFQFDLDSLREDALATVATL
jgi:hypothetical protein